MIVVALHGVGGSGEGRRGIVPDLVHPLNEFCGGFVRCAGGGDFCGVWVVAVHEVEWGESSQNMDSVVVGELVVFTPSSHPDGSQGSP